MNCLPRKKVEIASAPANLSNQFLEIFTPDCICFLTDLVSNFESSVAELLRIRKYKKLDLESSDELPTFPEPIKNGDWKIPALPPRLQCQHLGLGDVSPSNPLHFISALTSGVNGVQVDFDDGHCPTWSNTITGLHNVISFTKGAFHSDEVPPLEKAPLLLLRPRAWNMDEHNIFIGGKATPGPLVDFGILIYHIGLKLTEQNVGPYFFLSKVERASEAKLWNEIFTWSEAKLGLEHGTIKASVLIENILACFEAENILYELREHSFGLNCGIWDYAASIIAKFGHRAGFVIPERSKYVSMEKHFIKSYINHVIKTCHQHGAPATSGMAALTLSHSDIDKRIEITRRVCEGKKNEIEAGVDGFLVYDSQLVPALSSLWLGRPPNQIDSEQKNATEITREDLLQLPVGEVTLNGLKHNVRVGIQFIYSWLHNGVGNFILDGAVEDSATAEIARSQIWQWIYHQVPLEGDTRRLVTKTLVKQCIDELYKHATIKSSTNTEDTFMKQACQILLEVVTASEFPEYITTYLYNHSYFRAAHSQ
ncbi:unnamed protein product [Orchesella dallaii]|uniref:malate synthase n=1 Tax=Orchesella dallaii TaxID=48710 RepID=A0ABP1Q0Z5_9HEXA